MPYAPPTRREEAARAIGTLPGDVVPDQALLDRMIGPGGKLDEWFPMLDDLRTGIDRHRYQIETAWMFKALKRAKVKGVVNPGFRLLLAYLRPWAATGEPDKGPEDDYDDDLRLRKPTAAQAAAAAFRPDRYRPEPTPTPIPPVFRGDEGTRARYRLPDAPPPRPRTGTAG